VSSPRVGVLLSRVRVEEKLLLGELESRGVETKIIDDRELVLAVEHRPELGGEGVHRREALARILHTSGVDSIVFGDYALDVDTHMEVRAGVFNFTAAQDAATWVDELRGTHQFDPTGIATFYNDASGEYFSLFSVGTRAAILVCRSTSDAEAASRACEIPMTRIGPSWMLGLSTG